MISYCTNIYPAESWQETFASLEAGIPSIRHYLEEWKSPALNVPLGIGLRLSAKAATDLLTFPGEIERLKLWLSEWDAVVQTINGFPYGNFHEGRIKELVFKPDWTTYERFEYTEKLLNILARISPQEYIPLTVSTLPGSHKYFHADEERMFAYLDSLCGLMNRIHQETGKILTVGLEPEPMGHFDDTYGTIRFFHRLQGVSRRPELIQKHLGVTYDTCHFAVMGESPDFSLSAWNEYDIPVVKIQFSNALELNVSSPGDLSILLPYTEQTYFHQTSILLPDDNTPMLFADLPEALEWANRHPEVLHGSRFRIHYHIPLGATPEAPLENTHELNLAVVEYLRSHPHFRPVLEVETYTWNVLPPTLKQDISRQIASEIDTMQRLIDKYPFL